MRSSQGLLATIRVLASDLDGTLLNSDHEPSAGTFDAIREFEDAGGIFAVCTGRDLGSARGVLQGLDIDNMPGVYLNGTIVKGLKGVVLQSATLAQPLAKEIVAWGRNHRELASVLFVDGDTHYVMDRREEWAMYMHKHLLDPEPLEVEGGWGASSPMWRSAEPKIPPHINMMRVICSPENMHVVKPQIESMVEGQASCAQSLPTTIDIMALNTNKATGLHVLLKSLGLTEAQTAAIGDSENDLEMLQSVRVACAMGNAVQKTKAVAHFVMPTNRDQPSGVVTLVRSLTEALRKNPPPEETAAREGGGPRIKVAVFGGGSWGTPVARMVGQSVLQDPQYEEEVRLWVNDEIINGKRLTAIINETHENSKYMHGYSLPRNIKAVEDAVEAARGADILIFVERRDVLQTLLKDIKCHVKPSATAVVMSKDLMHIDADKLKFGSHIISETLGIPVAVLMGGTLAADIARGEFAEATLGCKDPEMMTKLVGLFNKPNFSVSALPDPHMVELFAVLKTVVSVAAGICDGVGVGFNTKSAMVRIGAVELNKFARHFYPQQASDAALHEACGWTDLIVSSFGDSRNRRWAEGFARDPARRWEVVAAQYLKDGKLPTGVGIICDLMSFIKAQRVEMEFPFFSKVFRIINRIDPPVSLTDMAVPRVRTSTAVKVAILGSGNWGCAIAGIVGDNVRRLPDFQKTVHMWVHEEQVDGRKLTDIINTEHRNVKYLPDCELPHNVVAVPSAVEAVTGAGVLIFVLPHQFLDSLLDVIADHVSPGAMAVSLVKGHMVVQGGGESLQTGSAVIAERLRLSECAVLNGANVADDVAKGNFAEATLGCSQEASAILLSRLFNSPRFSVRTSPDVFGVELFGGLKNVVALAAGFCDGMGLSQNVKAAVLRRGLLEMSVLIRHLYPASKPETLQESCGIADLLTTCYSGRNRRCAEAFAQDPSKSWEDIERELLNGQKLQGPSCCMDVQKLIDYRGLRDTLPLLTATHGAVTKRISPQDVFTNAGFLA